MRKLILNSVDLQAKRIDLLDGLSVSQLLVSFVSIHVPCELISTFSGSLECINVY